ncbi:MAG: phosphoribosylanthranilate isomerase [Syntrophomonadaceae bacterium]
MIRIKICGLTREEDINAVNRCLPEYIGFIFAESRRQVSPAQARFLKARLDKRIKAVGVFVNEGIETIAALCDAGTIDLVQLHGDEGADFLRELKQKVDCPVIKAVRVKNPEQVLAAQMLPCDLLLLDTYSEAHYGGGGLTFDHSLIPELHKPFFLAGGLYLDNIEQAIKDSHPWGVDISSGVESEGVKDEDKIKAIVARVRKLSSGKDR